jgi:Bacterial Ig-like domain (group 2)
MSSTVVRYLRALSALAVFAILASCGSGSPAPTQPTQPTQPATPAAPTVTVSSITVGTAGNAAPAISPGDKLQLFAQAINSDGSVTDVTNLAVWQSSNPVVGTVSPTGLLTAAAEGAVDVSASYSSRSGSLHADVQKAGCQVTLSPANLVFGALAGGGYVTVTPTLSSCRWTARSDASWLSFQFDPNRSGVGSFSYSVPGNNSTNPRDANIIISIDGRAVASHTIHQERPVGCVYTVTPEKLSFGQAGGRGSFNVVTQPGDCQWRITDSYSDVSFANTSGTGNATVTYMFTPASYSRFDHTFRVQGLSGLNPPGIHTLHVE